MNVSSAYTLPALVGGQYVLSSILGETADAVLYAAAQKDMRRDVIVESLKPEAARDPVRVRRFLDSARAQARMSGGNIASSLELLYADDTWHLAKERVKGESLDSMLAEGRLMPSFPICDLMLRLCRMCICMDIEKIAGIPFSLQNVYMVGMDFRFDNPACAGERRRSASRRVLVEAARQAELLLDPSSLMADQVKSVLETMRLNANWSVLSPLLYDESFARLQQRILQADSDGQGRGSEV